MHFIYYNYKTFAITCHTVYNYCVFVVKSDVKSKSTALGSREQLLNTTDVSLKTTVHKGNDSHLVAEDRKTHSKNPSVCRQLNLQA